MGAVADLVEVCFADSLDEGGRNYLRRMRRFAKQPFVMRQVQASMEWPNAPMMGYVWHQDGQLVGNASLIPFSIRGQRHYLIANVAVHPDYRRQGIARSLTEQAIVLARRQSVPSVWLNVRQENQAAVALYHSLDFIERARRTIWNSTPHYSGTKSLTPVLPPGGTKAALVRKLRAGDWEKQRAWLLEGYPDQISWHMPFTLQALRPGLLGAIYRLLMNVQVVQWAVEGGMHSARTSSTGDGLSGAVAWQAFPGRENHLWLAAPQQADEDLIHALLVYARRHVPSQRPLQLDYPTQRLQQAISEAGFKAEQTLIWMELPLA